MNKIAVFKLELFSKRFGPVQLALKLHQWNYSEYIRLRDKR